MARRQVAARAGAGVRQVPVPRLSFVAFAGVALLLAVPRIARLAYPQVWIEDDSYLHNAFLLARGALPYRDFPLPHLPLLEGLLAAIFQVAPISLRTAEVVTQVAAFVGSLMVFSLGRRLAGFAGGALGATVFATSALLFRYHLFEREVFLVVAVLGAYLIATAPRDDARSTAAPVCAGALLAVALAVKLTAVAACAALVIHLWLDRRRRSAAIIATTATALVAAASVALTVRFGTDFLVQVFLFRAVHATFPSLGVKLDEMRYSLDVSFAFGAAGIALILWRREVRRWAGPLLQIACGFIVLVLLNPTYWAHTGIELLPWLSVAAGGLLASALRTVSPTRHRGGSTVAAGRTATLTCLAGAIALLVFVSPIRNVNWQAGDGSVYGFGYRDRAELESMGDFVRAHSAPDAVVATPPIIAFVANRREAIPYPEVAGTMDELTTAVRRAGYWAALTSDAARNRSFWDSVEASRDRMAPRLDAALETQSVAVVINDSPDDLLAVPLVHVPTNTLERDGYSLESVSPHYEAWVPRLQGRAGRPPANPKK